MTVSVWEENSQSDINNNVLKKDISTDIAVIGAGIAGLLTAYELTKYGKEVIILEANTIAGGVTKNTTAKITSQHRLIYERLIKQFGREKAKQYADANERAIKDIAQIIKDNLIACDYEEKEAYVYSLEDNEKIKREADAAASLGIKADFAKTEMLPFETKGAVRFLEQAQFDPLKFLLPLSKKLTVYENTKALNIEDNIIYTDRFKVKANSIVVATHYPFLNVPGFYFLRMHQERSYVIAIENAQQINGMFIDENEKGYSFRNYKNLLLIGGEGHRTGESVEQSRYEALRNASKQWYPESEEIYHWSAQDCISVDEIPYIGQYAQSTPNIYVATGFKKWGMTNSMAAATLIADKIMGKQNKNCEIFDPHRFNISASAQNMLKDVKETVSGLASQIFKIPDEKMADIQKNSGAIIEMDGEKIGIYRDSEDRLFKVSVKCPHLGCELVWNQDELSWDCPCHGSRFDYKGKVIDNPSIKDLEVL